MLIFFFFITAYGWYEVSCTRRSRFKSKRQSSYQEIVNDASCQKFSRQEPMNLRTIFRNFARDHPYITSIRGLVESRVNFPDTLFILTVGRWIGQKKCNIVWGGPSLIISFNVFSPNWVKNHSHISWVGPGTFFDTTCKGAFNNYVDKKLPNFHPVLFLSI